MDIRKAKRQKTGTVPPRSITPEKKVASVPAIDNDGVAVAPMDMYGGDVVIAQYMEFLKENDITEEDITNVLSALITSGNVVWKFELLNQIPVEFQVRKSWLNDHILEVIDEETKGNEKVSMMRYNNMIAVCNLAASMTAYKDEQYRIDTKEDFAKARKRVQDMPYIIQNALVNKLAVFERVVAVAVSEWALKNFTKPRKEG